jgi:4-nitrophenol 2-monooxygenase / 4-nitrocatechol 4-monooxygenase, reductase component
MEADMNARAGLQQFSGSPRRVEDFRAIVGHFLSGVTVITTYHAGHAYGTTASAFTSLSLEPPMILVCLNQTSQTGAAVLRARRFAVNVLAEGQEAAALHFGRKDEDKFTDVDIDETSTAGPLLRDALATFDCRVVEDVVGGTHRVFLAAVERAAARRGAPLAYFSGRFGRLHGDPA